MPNGFTGAKELLGELRFCFQFIRAFLNLKNRVKNICNQSITDVKIINNDIRHTASNTVSNYKSQGV